MGRFFQKRNVVLASRKNGLKKINLFIVSFCIIIFLSLGFFLIKSDFFKIKSIDVKLDKISCSDPNQISNSSGLLGQDILFIDSLKVQDLIKNKFICVKEVNISRSFPNKVKLLISGRIPVAKISILKVNEATQSSFLENIATPSGQPLDSYFVDKEGVIYSKSTGQMDSPNIYFYNSSFSVGEHLDDTTKNSLEIIDRIKIFGLDVSKSLVSDNNFIIFSSPKIVFKLDSKVDIQLASLQLILEKAKIDNKTLEFVDLRFDKPIVKFAPKKNA